MSPDEWRWIWLGAAVVFAIGELATAGGFFLLPFAVGAVVACGLAFLGVGVGWEWLAFLVVSIGSVAAMRPLARRLDDDKASEGIGARRWIGQPATVLAEIPPGINETGMVRVGREEWRAGTVDGSTIPAGTQVKVVDVTGTRLVVWPVDAPAPKLPGAPPAE